MAVGAGPAVPERVGVESGEAGAQGGRAPCSHRARPQDRGPLGHPAPVHSTGQPPPPARASAGALGCSPFCEIFSHILKIDFSLIVNILQWVPYAKFGKQRKSHVKLATGKTYPFYFALFSNGLFLEKLKLLHSFGI